ncbi:hypothetical protein GGD63_005741 [Bradyrhizobium sp. cir1]|nr:hypothetical protein [Bradyrhizobium sp. cir1]
MAAHLRSRLPGDVPDDLPHKVTIIALKALLEDDDKDFSQ